MRRKSLILLLLSLGLSACSRRADLELEPPDWHFGSIPSNQVARSEVAVRNRGPRQVQLRFVSTCDCLQVREAPTELAAGEAARVRLSYDPQNQSGFVEAALVIVARQRRGESRAALRVYGKVLPAGQSGP